MSGVSKFTTENRRSILTMLRRGHYRKVACARVRIREQTLCAWLERGEQGEAPYDAFLLDVLEAEADIEDELLVEVREKGQCGASWIMERRWPKRWGGRVRSAVSEEVDMFASRFKSDPELHRRIIAKLAGEEPAVESAAEDRGTH